MDEKKLNVLLIKPHIMTDEILPPLGLGYLATSIRDMHNVKIIDGIKEKTTIDRLESKIREGNFDIVGIQCYTLDKQVVKDIIARTKRINPGIITVVGGPEPSADTNSVHEYFDSDFGFKGEAEIGFPMLVSYIAGKKISLGNIPGLIWKKNNEIKINPQKFVENLDDLRHPSWDLIQPNTYPEAPHGSFFKRKPTAPIFATRGCPFQCTFCAGFLVSGRRIRYRSIKNLVDEIEMLHIKYGINEIHLEDDNFSMKRQYVVDFCNELLNRGIDISWQCPNGVRLDTLDSELIDLMKKSGLYAVSVGIESGSDRILKDMKKNLSKETIKEKIKLIDKAGLDVIGFFILGYPGETLDDINQTIDFACELPLKRASFMTFKPFPGTEATAKVAEELKGMDLKWEDFALNKVLYSPKGITNRQLTKLRHKALRRFYFRPRIMYMFLKQLKSIQQIKYVSKRGFRWLTR